MAEQYDVPGTEYTVQELCDSINKFWSELATEWNKEHPDCKFTPTFVMPAEEN